MARLRLTKLILEDNWPGVPDQRFSTPTNGWDNTVDNFSSADNTARAFNNSGGSRRIRIGEKRQGYTDNTNCQGKFTMMYLCLHSFEKGLDISRDFSDGNMFHAPAGPGCISNSVWSDGSTGPYFVVSRGGFGSDVSKHCAVAVFCSTNTYSVGPDACVNGYGDGYGWAWVEGVCPCKEIAIFDDKTGSLKGAEITVDDNLDAGPVYLRRDGSSPILSGADGAVRIGWVCASANLVSK